MDLVGRILKFFMERRSANTSLDQLRQDLAAGGSAGAEQLARAADTPSNRKVARHVIGIERWSAHRLRSALTAAPTVLDEYDGYQPNENLTIAELAQAFRAARDETLAVAGLWKALPPRDVAHNQLGPISLKVWLVYIQGHGSMEMRKLR